jgi:hypothetical protein
VAFQADLLAYPITTFPVALAAAFLERRMNLIADYGVIVTAMRTVTGETAGYPCWEIPVTTGDIRLGMTSPA